MKILILNFAEDPKNYHIENNIFKKAKQKNMDAFSIHNFNFDYSPLAIFKKVKRYHYSKIKIEEVVRFKPDVVISIDYPWERDRAYLYFIELIKKLERAKKIIIATTLCPMPNQSAFIDDAREKQLLKLFKVLYIYEYDDINLWPSGCVIKKTDFYIDTIYYRPLRTKKTHDIFCFGSKSRVYSVFYDISKKAKILLLTQDKTIEKRKNIDVINFFENIFIIRNCLNRSFLTAIPIKDDEVNPACGNTAMFLSLACGVPVFIKDTDYTRKHIKEGVNGFLYKNLKDFNEKIYKIIEDKNRLLKMKNSCRKTAEKASMERFIERIFKEEI